MKRSQTFGMMTGAIALCIALPACASTGGGSAPAGQDANLITYDELQADPGLDVLAVIQSLRPRWLRVRGSATLSGPTPPGVIVDGVIQPAGMNALSTMRVISVQEIRFMNARDATTRYGPGMISGAILVTRRN